MAQSGLVWPGLAWSGLEFFYHTTLCQFEHMSPHRNCNGIHFSTWSIIFHNLKFITDLPPSFPFCRSDVCCWLFAFFFDFYCFTDFSLDLSLLAWFRNSNILIHFWFGDMRTFIIMPVTHSFSFVSFRSFGCSSKCAALCCVDVAAGIRAIRRRTLDRNGRRQPRNMCIAELCIAFPMVCFLEIYMKRTKRFRWIVRGWTNKSIWNALHMLRNVGMIFTPHFFQEAN